MTIAQTVTNTTIPVLMAVSPLVFFLQREPTRTRGRCPSCDPTNSGKVLNEKKTISKIHPQVFQTPCTPIHRHKDRQIHHKISSNTTGKNNKQNKNNKTVFISRSLLQVLQEK